MRFPDTLDKSRTPCSNGGMSSPTSRQLVLFLLFNLAYMAAAVAGAAVQGNREFVFYIVVMVLLAAVVAFVHVRVRLTLGQLWCLGAWGCAHMAGGLLPLPAGWPYNGDQAVLYSLWLIPGLLKYDQIVHAFGFGVTTWICWHALSSSLRARDGARPRPSFGLLTLCVAAGMGFGALNEVVEFIAVLSIPNTNVGGYENTGWDLVSNLAGSVIAALALRFRAP